MILLDFISTAQLYALNTQHHHDIKVWMHSLFTNTNCVQHNWHKTQP